MSKIMQKLIILMEPSEIPHHIAVKGGKMFFNRFCIDEDAAFEISGVHYLQYVNWKQYPNFKDLKAKGKRYKSLKINEIVV